MVQGPSQCIICHTVIRSLTHTQPSVIISIHIYYMYTYIEYFIFIYIYVNTYLYNLFSFSFLLQPINNWLLLDFFKGTFDAVIY